MPKHKSGVLRQARGAVRTNLPQTPVTPLEQVETLGTCGKTTIRSVNPLSLNFEMRLDSGQMSGLLAAWQYLVEETDGVCKEAIVNLYQEELDFGFNPDKWSRSDVKNLYPTGMTTNFRVGEPSTDRSDPDYEIDKRFFLYVVEGVEEAFEKISPLNPRRREVEILYHQLLNSLANGNYRDSKIKDEGKNEEVVDFSPLDLSVVLEEARRYSLKGGPIDKARQELETLVKHNNLNYLYYLALKNNGFLNLTIDQTEKVANAVSDLCVALHFSRESVIGRLDFLLLDWQD